MIDRREVTVGGRTVSYLAAGSGPPLVLLHAVGESGASWREVMPALAARHTVLAPDLPGFGGSAPLHPGRGVMLGPARLADAVAALLEVLPGTGDRPVVAVGSSLGGAVAVQLALRHPHRVSRLVLEDSAGLGRAVHPSLCLLSVPGYGELAVRAGRTRVGSLQRAWLRLPLLFSRCELAPPWWLEEHRRLARLPHHLPTTLAALRAQVDPLGQKRVLLEELAAVTVPTLVLWGDRDALLPLAHARAAAERLPDGRLTVVPRCGHLPHLERPEAFVAAIDDFDAVNGPPGE